MVRALKHRALTILVDSTLLLTLYLDSPKTSPVWLISPGTSVPVLALAATGCRPRPPLLETVRHSPRLRTEKRQRHQSLDSKDAGFFRPIPLLLREVVRLLPCLRMNCTQKGSHLASRGIVSICISKGSHKFFGLIKYLTELSTICC